MAQEFKSKNAVNVQHCDVQQCNALQGKTATASRAGRN